jgi:hypothetical protein
MQPNGKGTVMGMTHNVGDLGICWLTRWANEGLQRTPRVAGPEQEELDLLLAAPIEGVGDFRGPPPEVDRSGRGSGPL